MTPPRTIVGSLARVSGLDRPVTRRVIFAILIAVLVLLSIFPERHRAAVTLTPTDPTHLGFNPSQMQLYAINSVFGDHAALEVALRVAKSVYVRDAVIDRLKLMKRMGYSDRVRLHRWLQDEMTILSLRGGIIQFETRLKDADLARDIVGAYAAATQEQLARISRTQTSYKRDVLVELVTDASDRLARARGAYDAFRLRTNAPLPQESLQAVASRIPALEAAIKAKEVELSAARQFGTDQNMRVQQLAAELATLRQQLAQVKERSPLDDNSVGGAVLASAQGEKLQRELQIAQSLYDNYRRFLDGTSVEDLTSTANVRILEPPFIDTERQIDYRFLAAALALAMLWAAIEFYRLRPAVGDRVVIRETHA
jgi:hypothetical protein